MKNTIFILLAILTLMNCTSHNKKKMDQFVYDYEQIFTSDQKSQLNNFLKKFNKETSDQIVLITTNTYGDSENIETYSTEYIIINELGKINNNRNILIVFSEKKSEVKITVGEGLMDHINEDDTRMVTDSIMLPKFIEEKNFEGLWLGCNKLAELLKSAKTNK